MLLTAWILYFALWALAIWKSQYFTKTTIYILGAISLVDLVYLIMNDPRGLLLVLLGTAFAITGVMSSFNRGLVKAFEEEPA